MGIFGYVDNTGPVAFIKSNPQGLTTPTGRFIPPPIMVFEVLKYLELDTRVFRLINDIYLSQNSISSIAKSYKNITGKRLIDFARMGGFLMHAGQSFNRHPQYPVLMNNLIGLGRKFLDLFHIASIATGLFGLDPDIHIPNISTAVHCFATFINLAPDMENLMTLIGSMTTRMDQINHAVAGRVRLHQSGCFPAPIAP